MYIRKHNLQDPENKRKIICDDALRLVFETDCTDMFKMNKLLAKHILTLDPSSMLVEFGAYLFFFRFLNLINEYLLITVFLYCLQNNLFKPRNQKLKMILQGKVLIPVFILRCYQTH